MFSRAAVVRVGVALAAASAFAVPLLVALHARVPATATRPLFEPRPSDRLVPFELSATPASGRMAVYTARLAAADVPALTQHQRILVTVTTYRTVPRLLDAELSFAGIACVYRTARDIDLPDNRPLAFERDPACAASSAHATGDATIVFRLRNQARLALAAFLGASPPPRDALVLASPALAQARLSPVLQAQTVDTFPDLAPTRAELLAYMWDLRPGSRWLDAAIAACGALVGCAVLIGWPLPPPRRLAAARYAAAVFIGAFALSGAYAIVYPPFQMADEPSHFLVLSAYLDRPALGEEAAEWARRDMFEEIRFHTARPFSALDRGQPGRRWSEISVPMRDLYGSLRLLWRPLAATLRQTDVRQLFFTVRLFHAAGFALAAALFVLIVRAGTGSSASLAAAVPLFLVPTLPQFGMHLSNYAPLLDAYTLLGAGIVIASWDGARSWTAGAVLGLGLGAAISISRSSLALLPLVGCILAARVVLGDPLGRRWTAWPFWGGFTGLLALVLMSIRLSYADDIATHSLVMPSATQFTVLLRNPSLVLPVSAAGLIGELAVAHLRRAVTYRPAPAFVRAIALLAAAAAFVLFAASLFFRYPELPLYLPAQRPTAADYVRQAVLACATFLRFGRPDWLTSVTFFAGFGWLDSIPPNRLVALVAGTSGLMLVLLLAWTAWARAGRVLVWLGCAAIGFLGSAAAYALSVHRTTLSDLHGRYLLGLYLCTLLVCWSGLGRAAASPSAPTPSPSGRQAALTAALIAGAIAVNVYSLQLILVRYFS